MKVFEGSIIIIIIIIINIHIAGACDKFQSQQGQDAWVYSLYGASSSLFQPPLTFVELGASDGHTFSNTFGLEKCAGWHGVCIEPTTTGFHALLQSGRDKCVKLQKAVASSSRPATLVGGSANISDFWETSGVGGTLWAGLEEHFDTKSTIISGLKDASSGAIKSSANAMQVTTVPLADVLHSVTGLPPHVDYLSLDVEGAELEILETFPFSSRSFGVITVEHSWIEGYREDIKAVLESNGYVRAVCLGSDDGYILASLVTDDGALSSAKFDHRDCHQFRFSKDCAPGSVANTREFICNQSSLTRRFSGHCTNAVEQVLSWECRPGFEFHSASVNFAVENTVKVMVDINRAASLGFDLETLGSLHGDIRVIDKKSRLDKLAEDILMGEAGILECQKKIHEPGMAMMLRANQAVVAKAKAEREQLAEFAKASIELYVWSDTSIENIEDLSIRFCASFSELVMEGEENEKTRLSSCQDQLKTFILTQMDSYHAEAKIAALRDMEDTNTRTRAAGRQQEQQQPDL